MVDVHNCDKTGEDNINVLSGVDSGTDDGIKNQVKEQVTTKQDDIVEVFATATFENSPYESLQQEDLDSLLRCVNSMEHLKKNIETLSMDGHRTEAYGTTRFKHAVQLRIYVKTANLWENARSYLWKHLGRDRWD